MQSNNVYRAIPPRLWIALATTFFACAISLLGSITINTMIIDSPIRANFYSTYKLAGLIYDSVYIYSLITAITVLIIIIYTFLLAHKIIIIGGCITTLLLAPTETYKIFAKHAQISIIPLLTLIIFIILISKRKQKTANHQIPRIRGLTAIIIGSCISLSIAVLVNTTIFIMSEPILYPMGNQPGPERIVGNPLAQAVSIDLLCMFLSLLSIRFIQSVAREKR